MFPSDVGRPFFFTLEQIFELVLKVKGGNEAARAALSVHDQASGFACSYAARTGAEMDLSTAEYRSTGEKEYLELIAALNSRWDLPAPKPGALAPGELISRKGGAIILVANGAQGTRDYCVDPAGCTGKRTVYYASNVMVAHVTGFYSWGRVILWWRWDPRMKRLEMLGCAPKLLSKPLGGDPPRGWQFGSYSLLPPDEPGF